MDKKIWEYPCEMPLCTNPAKAAIFGYEDPINDSRPSCSYRVCGTCKPIASKWANEALERWAT